MGNRRELWFFIGHCISSSGVPSRRKLRHFLVHVKFEKNMTELKRFVCE